MQARFHGHAKNSIQDMYVVLNVNKITSEVHNFYARQEFDFEHYAM